jgi:chromosome segregation ATPase
MTNSAVIDTPPSAPHLVFPVTVSTNEHGVVAHHFSMKPAITNMIAATNDLGQLKAQQAELEDALKKASDEGGVLKKTIRTDYLNIVGVMTNFSARSPDGKKLQERIQELETELKGLKQEFQKKLDEDESYKQARAKVEADREAMKTFEEKMADLRRKRTEVGAKVWQLQTVVSQTLKDEEDKRANEEKAQKDKSESAP